jgi:D-alanyl-D-alanine carboxypeptidase (penicillin-binding protein 5/6)
MRLSGNMNQPVCARERTLSRRSLLGAITAIGFGAAVSPALVTAQDEAALSPAGISAQSVYAYDVTAGVLLYAREPDKKLAVGSLVKVTTALVVVETIEDLSEHVVIDQTDLVDISVYSNMQLVAGDTLSVSLLLYGLLIPSGNDGARALARHVGGKIANTTDPDLARAAFVERMNAFAKEHGMNNSQYQNADGTDERDTWSTARDVTTAFDLLMQNETLANIVNQPAYQFTSLGPEKRTYSEDTTDRLLGQSGVVGGKTGTTEEAGACVALARKVTSGNLVITALLGAKHAYSTNAEPDTDERWNDASTILAAMDQEFTWVDPQSGDALPGLVEEMAVWQVETKNQPPVPLRVGDKNSLYQLVLGEPVAAGEQAGHVDLYYGDAALGAFPVYQVT